MYKDLSHLTEDKLNELIKRYYDGENIQKLIEEFELDVKKSELYKLFPVEEFLEYKCQYCEQALVANRLSKTNAKYGHRQSDLYCPTCGHKLIKDCSCNNCMQARVKEEKERINNIFNCFGNLIEPIEFQKLSFKEKVYLGSICRTNLRENLVEIAPTSEENTVLAPSDELYLEIYNTLYEANAIIVSPTSDLEAFDFDKENYPISFSVYKVIYNLNLKFREDNKENVLEILNPTYYTEHNQNEALELWFRIAVAECVEYLEYTLNKVGFSFSPGDKTYTTFRILLNNFSVSQIYGIIWKSVADASKLYLERSMSKRHAANTVIGACQRYAERAITKKWDLTGYKRIKELPQSSLSEFFFYRVLGIGEMGFEVPPTMV